MRQNRSERMDRDCFRLVVPEGTALHPQAVITPDGRWRFPECVVRAVVFQGRVITVSRHHRGKHVVPELGFESVMRIKWLQVSDFYFALHFTKGNKYFTLVSSDGVTHKVIEHEGYTVFSDMLLRFVTRVSPRLYLVHNTNTEESVQLMAVPKHLNAPLVKLCDDDHNTIVFQSNQYYQAYRQHGLSVSATRDDLNHFQPFEMTKVIDEIRGEHAKLIDMFYPQ